MSLNERRSGKCLATGGALVHWLNRNYLQSAWRLPEHEDRPPEYTVALEVEARAHLVAVWPDGFEWQVGG